VIVPDFPALFAEFRSKRFLLLWRGSRDGFMAKNFHGCCDTHAPTLTLVLDTGGSIFGGFTPAAWEPSLSGIPKADPSLTSFLFTLKNPHDFPATKFALKEKKKDEAIYCELSRGPHFFDFGIRDGCSTNANNHSHNFGHHYTNDTGLPGTTFFTGAKFFTVREIEVFEIQG
jgi:hypothetical protein